MKTPAFDGLLKHRYKILIGLIIIVSLFVGLRYINMDSVWPDEAFYAWNGYNLIKEPFHITDEMLKTPVYVPFVIIGFLSIFMDKFIAAKLMVLLFSIIGICSTFVIGKMLKNELVGFLAAGFMTFNAIVMFLSTRALTDIPIAAMMALCVLMLFKYEQEKHWKWGLIFGLCITGMFYTKMSGIIFIPVLGLYFILTRRTKIFKELKNKKFLALLGVGTATFVPFFIFNIIKFGSLLPSSLAVYSTYHFFEGGRLYYITNMPAFVSWWMVLFLLIGLLFAVLNFKRPKQLTLVLWFIIGLSVISCFGEKDLRYFGPIMPAIFLLIAYGVSMLKFNSISEWVIVGLAAVFMISSFGGGINHIESKAALYTGFREAGEWMNTFVPESAVVYAGSERAIRSFGDLQYEEYGGNVKLFPQNISDFKNQVENQSNVYLEIDVWEYTQPGWVYPMDANKVNELLNMSFKINYVVQRNVSGQLYPVVMILGK